MSSASYPSSVKSFTNKSAGQPIAAQTTNDLQDEVAAIEQDLISGLPVARGGTGLSAIGAAGTVLASNGSVASWVSRALFLEPCGRLTLTSATPVTTADVTAATTLYYALYHGNQIALYTGSGWVLSTIAELSIAVPATTNQLYDVFVDYNSGTPQLSLTAWTNDTTRATALVRQDGVWVLTGSTGKRWVGCMRTTGVSGQTEDSHARRLVVNFYHQKPRVLRKTYPDSSWTYTTATWRQANANAANQVDWITPITDGPVSLTLNGSAGNGTAVNLGIAIGIDSTSAPVSGLTGGFGQTTAITNTPFTPAIYNGFTAAGYHYAAGLEYSGASGTTTWYGSQSPLGVASTTPSGLSGSVMG